MCHESSGVALNESIGIGKGSVTLDDFYKAEVIIILGQNPGTNHPRMLSALQKAKENGCFIISINPLPETGLISFSNPQTLKGALGIKAKLTDIFLQVKINGDMALLQAIELLLLQEEENIGIGSGADTSIHDDRHGGNLLAHNAHIVRILTRGTRGQPEAPRVERERERERERRAHHSTYRALL